MKWTIIKDTFDTLDIDIRLHPGEGTVVSDTIRLRVGSKFVNPNVEPPEGLHLEGWYKDNEFSVKANQGETVDSTFANLYAKFKSLNFADYVYPNASGTYFDTGIAPTDETYFELDFVTPTRFKQSSGWPVLLGSMSRDDISNEMFIRYNSPPTAGELQWLYFIQRSVHWYSAYIDYDTRHTFKIGPNLAVLDGVIMPADPFQSVTTDRSVFLFAGNNGSAWRPQQFYCYGLKVWRGDELIANFRPYMDDNGNGAFYEEVTGEIRYASSAMTAGND